MVNNSVEGKAFLSVTEFRNNASLFAAAVVTPSSSHLSKGRLGDLAVGQLPCLIVPKVANPITPKGLQAEPAHWHHSKDLP